MAETEVLEDVLSEEGTPCYSNAFSNMWIGFKELLICLGISLRKNSKEIAIGALHHYLFSVILIGSFVYMTITLIHARTERDAACKTSYYLQQQNDSMKIILGKH